MVILVRKAAAALLGAALVACLLAGCGSDVLDLVKQLGRREGGFDDRVKRAINQLFN